MKILVTILTVSLIFTGSIVLNKKQTITATVVNVSSKNGKVTFGLYDEENFMKKPLQSKNGKIVDGKSTVTFENIESGDYAILCFHDENNNDKIDFELSGMPTEDYGASNNAMSFGPPQYQDAKFTVSNENISLEIKF